MIPPQKKKEDKFEFFYSLHYVFEKKELQTITLET